MAKIVFIDVDGTLMDTSGGEIYIPQENIDTIQEAVKRGVHICISSGRMTNSALLICKKVGIEKEYLKFDWSFEDPKNTIWEIFKDKGKKMGNINHSCIYDSKIHGGM